MKRRSLLLGGALMPIAAARHAGAMPVSLGAGAVPGPDKERSAPLPPLTGRIAPAGVQGYAVGPVIRHDGAEWRVHEDRARPDGDLVLIRADGAGLRLGKRLESYEPLAAPFLGLDPAHLGQNGADLLADRLLAGGGDPDPAQVRDAALSPATRFDPNAVGGRIVWSVFIGTRQGTQPMPLSATGSTRTLHADQIMRVRGDLHAQAALRSEGLLGGDLPIVLHRIPDGEGRAWEVMSVADVAAPAGAGVPAVQRICLIENGLVVQTHYRGTYPAFGPYRPELTADAFFAVLLDAVAYWRAKLADMARCRLPEPVWSDMARHAFVKELITKPGGVHPAYGAVDRDYAGSEYDGFQDTITSTLLANLLWGRFEQASAILDNALSVFTDANGLAVMRGQEVGQTGLMLHLVARFVLMTGDISVPRRHRDRIRAIASVLTTLHDAALRKPEQDPGHGLLSGWSESDSCLFPDPSVWWKPYYGNSALAARGLRDLSACWVRIDPDGEAAAQDWARRSEALSVSLERSLRGAIRHDLSPPYVPILPGVRETFRESLARATRAQPSEQQWPHRVYSELLQAGILSRDLERLTIDSMRGHGATSMGVVANIGAPDPGPRDMLGFISYGYAEALLRQDRIPEYLLFLYAHRFHCHTPGSWTAAEVADLSGGLPLFCIPAQMTIPILLRWMLCYEDRDAEVLHLCRAIPETWWNDPAGIEARDLPTIWGRVGFSVSLDATRHVVRVAINPPASAVELRLHLRLPSGWRIEPKAGLDLVSNHQAVLRIPSAGTPLSLNVPLQHVP
ncbi:Tat pathway signal protein [Acetobacteraceae bacterium KSS8]|uniref:Tat pathway signal protein n=1 Tax=Endosaccharibacter trunci TaxID=2812733 RepID=A0ABT1W853_9PROT|nr:Tat pathway signal protein [Acetobacteraceae bacterium KSS8]